MTVLAIKRFCTRKYVTIFAIKFFWLWKLIILKGYGQKHQLQYEHMKDLLQVHVKLFSIKISFVKSSCINLNAQIFSCEGQRYTYRVLQTIQRKLIFLCVTAILDSA